MFVHLPHGDLSLWSCADYRFFLPHLKYFCYIISPTQNLIYCLFFVAQSVSSQSGTAIGGLDYTDISSQELTFIPGGPTEQDIVVGINDDNLLEGTEFFLLTVSSQNANTRIGNYENTTVRIFDDDGKCLFQKT